MTNDNNPLNEPLEESTGESLLEKAVENEAGSKPTSDFESLQQQLEEAQQKADENWEIALRAQAETDNVRKRAVKDLENAHKYSIEKLVNEFLPVKDSLELGINAADQADVKSLVEGMDLTLKAFSNALEKCGVEEIDPVGEKFNPEFHQAMTMIESPDVESGAVIEVMQKGYLLNDRLIRPAMVVVAK